MVLASNAARQTKKSYRLDYTENEHGVDKRVEMRALSLREVIDLAQADPAKRDVRIHESGRFACRVTRRGLVFSP